MINFKYKYKISDVKNLIRKMGVKLEYLELRDKHTLSKYCNKSNFIYCMLGIHLKNLR